MKKLIAVLSLIILTGCYSPRVANNYLNVLYKKHPAFVDAKMEQFHKCNWYVVKLTSAEERMVDSIFNLTKSNEKN